MNFRTTAILFGVLLAFGLVLLGLAIWDTDQGPPTDALLEELARAGVKADQIDAVEIERPGAGTLKMKRTGKDRWEIVEPLHARADQFAVERVINDLLRAKPTTYGELTDNPALHGLDNPSLRVTLRQGDERAGTVNLGDVTFGGTKAVVFVTTPARKRPMAVPRSDLSALFRDTLSSSHGKAGDLAKWTADYRVRSVFSADARLAEQDVQAVRLSAKGKDLALRQTSDGWTITTPAGWGAADVAGDGVNEKTFTGVRPLLNFLTGLQAGTVEDFIEQPKDLKEYGLNPDDPDRTRVELEYKDGRKEVVFLGKKADAAPPPAVPGMPTPPSNKVYVQVEGDAGVIRANAGGNLDNLANLIADPSAIRDRTLLHADKGRIDALDITAGGQTTKLRKAGPTLQWTLFGPPGDPEPAGTAAVNQLLDLLTERRTIRDFPPLDDANFAGPELKAEVKVWTDAIEPGSASDPKVEPKLKGNPVTLQFGKKEGDSIYVRRIRPDGSKADFKLPEAVKVGGAAGTVATLPAAVTKTRLDLLDPALKSFAATNANRLTIAKGPEVVEVAQEGKSDAAPFGAAKWSFVRPESRKGQPADASEVSSLLGMLGSLTASRFIDEQPTDAKLAEYGLDPKGPRVRATVGLTTEADKERVYDFGNETPDGFVYARQQGRAAVFLVPKATFDRVANTDLRDKTVVRFDRAKVTGLRLRGWREATGVVTTLEFEKKGADWVAKTPPGYAVDPNKVNAFLGLLDGLRAKAFVSGPQKPEHGFPPEQQGLEITIELEGQPGIAVNIAGPADSGASYYGWTNALPANENLFTVPAEPFKPYKERPAAFAK